MEVDQPASSMKYALITYLDSNPDVSSIFENSKHLIRLNMKYKAIGQSVRLLTQSLLVAQQRQRIFFGFDEVWFFPQSKIERKPEGLVITAPYSPDSHQLDAYYRWLAASKGSLGLGDGIGMNYYLRVRGVPKYIVQAVNENKPRSPGGEKQSA